MSFQSVGPAAIDYYPCRYGTSRLVFRGPRRRLHGDYAVYLGGAETYGKFMPVPYPVEVELMTGLKSVNLGCPKLGIDSYLSDESLLRIAQTARVVVIEIVGAQNVSNRFYRVHPRRNDRFIKASERLRSIYPDVDFTEFSFVRHLLHSLRAASAERFAPVVEELRTAWVARMSSLIQEIPAPVILLWMSDHQKDAVDEPGEPLFVDSDMIQALPKVHALVEVTPTHAERGAGQADMVYTELERPAAKGMLGTVAHRRAAHALADVIRALM